MKLQYSLVILFVFAYTSSFAQFGQSTNFAATKASCPIISDDQLDEYFKQYTLWCDSKNLICNIDDTDLKSKEYARRVNKVASNSILKDEGIDVKAYISNKITTFSSPCGSVRISSGLMDILTDDELLVVMIYETGHIINKNSEAAFKKCLLDDVLVKSLKKGESIGEQLSEEQLSALSDSFKNYKFSKRKYYAADNYTYEQLNLMKKDPKILSKVLDKEKEHEEKSFFNYKEKRTEKLVKLYSKN